MILQNIILQNHLFSIHKYDKTVFWVIPISTSNYWPCTNYLEVRK